MKMIHLALLAIFLTTSPRLFAQEEDFDVSSPVRTIFGDQPTALGGYISFGMGNAALKGHNAFAGQMRLAARINHSLSIGVAGTGFTDMIGGLNYDRLETIPDGYYIDGGYGGLLLEPVFAPDFPVHLSFPMLFGAGGVALTEDRNIYDWEDWEYDNERFAIEAAPFLILEPGVEMEINLSRFMRLGLMVSYRFTTAVRLDAGREYLMNGFHAGALLKLGVF
ncbi:hypothetical protein [Lentimicrobium saccharophilum]|nr:hypothetical protein [Lentimicrobium saccharophilum]